MRTGQVTALVLLALVPLSALAITATVVLGGPVMRSGVERRAQAIALAGGSALATGASSFAARRTAEAYAAELGLARSERTVVATDAAVHVTVRVPAVSLRLPGTVRALRVELVSVASAAPTMTQDDRPGAVLIGP